jgi:hypothetical protein
MSITEFPTDAARQATSRMRLVRWLRELADIIEADQAATEPHAVLITLTGKSQHEVVSFGYGRDDQGFREAGEVAHKVASFWRTMGRNIRKRYSYLPRPMRDGNVIDGQFPSQKGREAAR